MLTLARRIGESIVLFVDGKEIEIILTDVSGSQAWLSFVADNDVKILREELVDMDGTA